MHHFTKVKFSPILIFFRKFLNTFLTPKFLWKYVVTGYSHKNEIDRTAVQKILFKFFWFWPSMYRINSWKSATPDSGHGYEKFLKMDDKAAFLMDEVVLFTPNPQANILDLGCNIGRCLNYLSSKGYKNLHGVDVSKPAIDMIPDVFPKMFSVASIELESFESYLSKKDDLFFNTTFTLGATVELVPSSFPLIREITRVTSEYVCFMISPSGHWYPRFWEYEFQKNSFILVKKYLYSYDKSVRGAAVLLIFKRKAQ